MLKYLSFITILLQLNVTFSYSQDITKIRINPEVANGGKFSELFDSVEFIPLETTKESLFGTTNKLVITDSSYVVGDFDTKSVYFFSINGKFLNKVKLPFDDRLIMDISLEADKQRVAIRTLNLSNQKGDCKYFYLNGNMQNISITNIVKFDYVNQVYLGDGFSVIFDNIYLNRGSKASDSVSHMIQILKDNRKYISYLPFSQSTHKLLCRLIGGYSLAWGHPLIVNKSMFYLSEPLSHRVYKVTKDSIQPIFQFVLPSNRLISQDIITNNSIKSVDSLVDLITYDNKLILQISNISYVDNYLYFKFMPKVFLSSLSSESEFQYNFLLDKSNKLISFERITQDNTNFYLPIIGHTGKRDGLEIYKDKLYTSLSSLEMFNNYDKSKESIYSDILKNYFKNENRKSNPVIIKYKLHKK